jgi:purine-nucleoside phosphorylase
MDYRHTAEWLSSKLPVLPSTGIILGTGLGALAEILEEKIILPYNEIPGFVQSTAPSHAGNLLFGYLAGKPVLCLQGRFHYYEGYSMEEVVFPVRVMACLGIKLLIVTNASGSLRQELKPGQIVLLTDHINFMGTNPLIGKNDEQLGERFPSMNLPYSITMHARIERIAQQNKISVCKGVYAGVTGPSLETRAECAMFAQLGADLVGMSTVPEVIAARHCGLEVLGISVVTNYSNLFHNLEHSQEEIRHNADLAADNLKVMVTQLLSELPV